MRYIVLIWFILYVGPMEAQKDIKIIAKSTKNGIKIRWIIPNSTVWMNGLDNGYKLEKASYLKGRQFDELTYKTTSIIKQWSPQQWQEYSSSLSNDEKASMDFNYNGIAYSLVEGKEYLNKDATITEIMEYKKEIENAYFYAKLCSVQSWVAAELLSLGFYDKDVTIGEEYVYRLSPLFMDNNEEFKPVFVKIFYDVEPILDIANIMVEELDQRISLSWKKGTRTTSHFIEYSDNGKEFKRHNEKPFYKMYSSIEEKDSIEVYDVDNLENFQRYYFRIIAKDVFAEDRIIGYAEGTPRDLTPPSRPFITIVEGNSLGNARIEWIFPEEENDDLKGFRIGRSNVQDGEYLQIHKGFVPKEWRAFDDEYFSQDTANFYLIEAIDKSENVATSDFFYYTVKDSFPPDQPVNISAMMDSVGLVTLEMEPQEERDFMGYRIYMANNPNSEFSVIQETYNDSIVANARNPVIIDTSTVESLSQFIYYKIGALDYHYNESQPSEIIKVPRPDKFPPVPPLITGYKAHEDRIHFDIALSTSFDIKQNYLYRKEASEEEWSVLDSLGVGFDAIYIDSTGEAKVDYLYSLKAVDEGGLESEFGNQMKLSILRNDDQLGVIPLIKYFEEGKSTLITWEYQTNLPEDISSFIIIVQTENRTFQESYRALDKQGLILETKEPPKKVTIIPQSRKRQYSAIVESEIAVANIKMEDDPAFKFLEKNR